jgi:hypothetical protein
MSQFFPEGEGSHPLHKDGDGGYITNAQMQFFLNRQQPKDHILDHGKFLKYLLTCKKYNMISDYMEKDPESACLVWNDERQAISFIFPAKGVVAEKMLSFYLRGEDDDDDEEDLEEIEW